MAPRVLIPTDDSEGKHVAPHFGRAPYFAVFDVDNAGKVTPEAVYENTGSHRGGKGHAHDNVLTLSPRIIIVSGMGPRGIRSFQEAGVAVLKADSDLVSRVLESYSKGLLSELSEGCADAHDK